MDIDEDLDALPRILDHCMTPLREVDIRSFVLETRAWEANVTRLPEQDPRYGAVAAHARPGLSIRTQGMRVELDDDGHPAVYADANRTASDVDRELQRSGFRLPTSDEWEYACGGGARTLFRWGDHIPIDCTPPPLDADAPEDERFAPVAEPNAFGLYIANNPYHPEYCADPETMRGGDGGAGMHGGEWLNAWCSLASPYTRRIAACRAPPSAHARRVVAI